MYDRFGNEVSLARIRFIKDFPGTDLAFLEIEMNGVDFEVAELATQLPIENEPVFAVGYPGLRSRSKGAWVGTRPADYKKNIKRISTGKVTEIHSSIEFPKYPYHQTLTTTLRLPTAIFHSADILSGNSGGALVNGAGKLVGLPTGIFNNPSDNRHCGNPNEAATKDCYYFAVPSTLVLAHLSEIN
jgi:S1-C subfamily serine protease